MAEALNEEMVASYTVTIEGVERTAKQIAALDYEISLLRGTKYMDDVVNAKGVVILKGATVTKTANAQKGTRMDGRDILVTKFRKVEGRVQRHVNRAMSTSMALGKRTQTAALDAAETRTGRARKGGTAGRRTGKPHGMIASIGTNVETLRVPNATTITGWHGWGRDNRKHFEYQEKGTKGKGGDETANSSIPRNVNKVKKRYSGQKSSNGRGVPAANSLGLSIITVRENLKRELGNLR